MSRVTKEVSLVQLYLLTYNENKNKKIVMNRETLTTSGIVLTLRPYALSHNLYIPSFWINLLLNPHVCIIFGQVVAIL